MQRIDGPTAAPTLPTPGAVSGTPGYFTGGNPAVPTAPTTVSPDWLNMIQEELMAVILAAGITPSKSNNAQLLAALSVIITNALQFASDAEAIAGTLTTKSLTPHSGLALVNNRIAALVNGAPTALDTLKELADAINDDANFAASVTAGLAARALAAIQITGAGLATGGGDLTGNRSINVPASSSAEVIAGASSTKAITPAALAAAIGASPGSGGTPPAEVTLTLPGGWQVKVGHYTGTMPIEGAISVTFGSAFPNAGVFGFASMINGSSDILLNSGIQSVSVSTAAATFFVQKYNDPCTSAPGFYYLAVGY